MILQNFTNERIATCLYIYMYNKHSPVSCHGIIITVTHAVARYKTIGESITYTQSCSYHYKSTEEIYICRDGGAKNQ